MNIADVLKHTFEHYADKDRPKIVSGFKKLDRMLTEFVPGKVTAVIGDVGSGKVSFVSSMALPISKKHKVAWCSYRYKFNEIMTIFLSHESGIPISNILTNDLSSQEWISLTHVAAAIAEHTFDFQFPSLFSLEELISFIEGSDARLIIIDNIDAISIPDKNIFETKTLALEAITRLARQLNKHIIVLGLPFTNPNKKTDKRISMGDIDSSYGRLVSTIIFLYRDIMYNPETEYPSLSELHVARNQCGPTGIVFLEFVRELMKFEETNYDS